MNRTLAAAQPVPVPGDVDANITEHVRLIHAADPEHPDVIVFPELSLTGYELALGPKLAFAPDDARLAPLIDAASAHNTTVIVGAPVRIDSALHIGAFIVTPRGTVDVYTKHYLGAFSSDDNPDGPIPPAEASVFSPGALNPLVALADGTAALAVCADVGHPEHAQAAADRGANTYLASMFVIPQDYKDEMRNLESYATQHAMAVVFSNYGGPSAGLPSAGKSAIFSQTGELLAQLAASGPGLVIATEDEREWQAKAVSLSSTRAR